MGCNTVSASFDSEALKQIRTAISKDDVRAMTIAEDRNVISTTTDLSPSNALWRGLHFCCRWDSPRCLQFLLKNKYANEPKDYIEFVNARTNDGQTCLHLCGVWGAQKCFNILLSYGGLGLEMLDKFKKTPLILAQEYKRTKIAQALLEAIETYEGLMPVNHEEISKPLQIAGMINPYEQNQETKIIQKNPTPPTVHVEFVQSLLQMQLEKEKIDIERNNLRAALNKRQEQIAKRLKEIQNENKKAQQQITKIKHLQMQRIKDEQQNRLKQALNKKEEQVMRMKKQIEILKENELKRKMQQEKKKAQQISQQKKQQGKKILQSLKIQLQKSVVQIKKRQISAPPAAAKPVQTSELPPHILQKYEQAKKQGCFRDPDFPQNDSSLGSEKYRAKIESLTQDLAWLRPFEFMNGKYDLFDGIDPNDIKQGQLGVCYMLATISQLARDPENIKKLFAFSDISVGFYVLKFYRHGRLTYVPVDDFIPCSKSRKEPLFTKPIGNEVWVLLVEKAWSKTIGSYFAAEGMAPDQCMEDLTGAASYGLSFKDLTDKTQNIKKQMANGSVVVLTSGTEKIAGLVNNHAYSLLQIIRHNDTDIFKLRNPWGKFQWNGTYGQKSRIWTPQLQAKCKIIDSNDGIFYLSLNEVLQAFPYYSVSQILPKFKYSYTQIEGSENIYISFQLKNDTLLDLRVTQLFNRMVNDPSYKYSPLLFEVGKFIENDQIQLLTEGSENCYWGNKSVHANDQNMKNYTKGTYFIRIKMYWKNPAKYHNAVLGAYCNQNIQFVRLDQNQGLENWKTMIINSQMKKKMTQNNQIQYRMEWMRGQLICIAYLTEGEEDETCNVNWKFNPASLVNCEFGLQTNDDGQMNFQVGVGPENANFGTLEKLVISQGCSSGSVQISTDVDDQ